MEKHSKILVVDDNPGILSVIADALPHQQELLYAKDGQKAIDLAQTEKPDLILMDWEMPVLPGLQAVQMLQADEATREIPIIIHSGLRVQPQDLAEALQSGAVDFISKPFSQVELRARVYANLRLAQQHAQIKRLLEDSLDRKNRALASSALYEYNQKQMLDSLLHRMQKIAFDSPKEIRGQLNELYQQTQEKLKTPQSWEHFKVLFEEVHPRFFQQLRQTFPALSASDLKIAAYIKIGLEVKDIASLNAVSPASVRRSFNRMKHKMGLSPEQGLYDCILSL